MTPRTHRLKTAHDYWEAVKSGDKRFEVRKNDRGFQPGDTVILEKLRQDYPNKYDLVDFDSMDPKSLTFKIGWMLVGGQLGIEPGYVVFSLDPVSA